MDINPEVHYLDAPLAIRRSQVEKRNTKKDPSVYAFDVTEFMINFMESRFEKPDADELKNGLEIDAR